MAGTRKLTIKLHHFLPGDDAFVVFIVDILGGLVAAFGALLRLGLFANKVTEPSNAE